MSDQTQASDHTQEGGVKSLAAEGDHPARIVIDRAYIRNQARDAMLTFIAPLQGVYLAAIGTKIPDAAAESVEAKKER